MNIHRQGREATVTLPNWLWGLVITVGVTLLGASIYGGGWFFNHSMQTRELTNNNTADIRHIEKNQETFHRAINEKTTRIDEKLDRVMELIIHYGNPAK